MKRIISILCLLCAFISFAQDEGASVSDIPDDILELERSFEEDGASLEDQDVLVSELDQGLPSGKPFGLEEDPGASLPPSEKFSRVPLRPQMSDRSWLRYAGPYHEKVYKVKKGDSLWVISERLFGNPHLWPKVWQLNAVLGNAHILKPGRELLFTPGNGNSAPMLAFKAIPGRNDLYLPPLVGHLKAGGLSDKISSALQDSENGFNRFRSFLLKNLPEVVSKIPRDDRSGNKIVFGKGDKFQIKDIPPGEYAIVRMKDPEVRKVSAKILWWLGTITVREMINENDLNAEISQSFESITHGDLIVMRTFAQAPLALHNEVLGPERRHEVKLVNIDTSLITLSAEDYLIGAKFSNEATGPSLGGIINLYREKDWVASAVLIDRDEDVGTFWVVESNREVLASDYVE
ncbi:LysM peptidoglycan-binding domain-containing protein [bacterium]|nr:LysM peptidoglycan-binding domain-containing protein [bacterium]